VIERLKRPMHIEMSKDQLIIPDFSTDCISIFIQESLSKLQINDSLDAPSGVSTLNDLTAIADFYKWKSFI